MGYATESVTWGETVPGWQRGMSAVAVPSTIQVACCPECGFSEPCHKGTNGVDSLVRWHCPRCDHRWKRTDSKVGKVNLVG